MIILGTNSIKDTGFDVANSCRFDYASSEYVHKTPGSAGSGTKFVFSTWIKRTKLATAMNIIYAETDTSNYERIRFVGTDKIEISGVASASTAYNFATDAVYRDPSAWMHLHVIRDSTQGTASNRLKVYVNGVLQALTQDTALALNYSGFINGANVHRIGIGNGEPLGAYLAEVILLDGQVITPDGNTGEFDSDSGIWKPIDVSGLTFGTNGFYLDFEDSSNLGNDANGGTDLTEVNLAATDQSTDTCTNNFNTPNPLYGMQAIRVPVFAEGNLKITGDGDANHHQTMGTFAVNKGKWFWEAKFTVSADIGKNKIGIMSTELGSPQTDELGDQSGSCLYINEDGGDFRRDNATVDQNAGVCTLNQIVSVALNMDDGEISIYRAGSLIVDALAIGNAAGTYVTPASMHYRDAGMEFNFGSPPYSESGGNSDGNGYGNYSMSVPSGYYSWNTKNLAEYG